MNLLMAMFLSAFLSWLATPLVIALARRFNLLDYPNDPRKVHTRPTPRLGSLPLFVGWVIGLMAVGFVKTDDPLITRWLMATAVLVLIGVLDDMERLHSQVKLFLAMPVAALVVMQHPDVRLYFLPHRTLNLILTFLWLVGIPAAFNLLDGVDGLVSGVSLFTMLSFSMMNFWKGHLAVANAGFLLLAALVAFLYWNFPPARIFLGDAGAMLLGFSAALLGILAPIGLPSLVSWTVPVIMLGLPIFDTAYVSIMRLREGKVPFASPGRDHTHHRLLALGWSPRRVTLTLWGVTLVLNGVGLGLWWVQPPYWVFLAVVAILVVLAVIAGWYLAKITI